MDGLVVAVAVITGLTEVIKRLKIKGKQLPTSFVPLLAVILGVLYAGFIVAWEPVTLVGGVVAGLTSVGLYRTVQKTVK